MSDMKKLLESIDRLTECPPMEGPAAPPTNPGNPVTLSVNFNASGKEHVEDLLGMMKNAGLAPMGPAPAPNLPMRQDMDRLRAIVGEPEMEADEAYADSVEDDEDLEEYENEPEPEYQDHKFMTKDLSGGLNREKKAYKAAQDGDNAMAVEAIKAQLMAALAEKKAKPDFLDMDKDGNKKEPMKKAIADKKKKTDEAEVQAPTHELSDTARKATNIAQMIKRKINSGEQMDDRDYNQMAELGSVLSRFGASFGPKSMKDVLDHMVQYTDDRNEEGHEYPEFNVDRFKELIAMAK